MYWALAAALARRYRCDEAVQLLRQHPEAVDAPEDTSQPDIAEGYLAIGRPAGAQAFFAACAWENVQCRRRSLHDMLMLDGYSLEAQKRGGCCWLACIVSYRREEKS